MRLTADVLLRALSAPGVPAGNGQFARLEAEAWTTKADRKVSIDRSKSRSCRDQVRGVFARAGDSTIGFTFRDVAPLTLAGHLLGSQSTLAVTGGTVTDEATTPKEFGTWIKLAHEHLADAGVSLTKASPAQTYKEAVNGTLAADGSAADYALNRRLGMWMPLAGGAIALNAALAIDYAYGTVAGIQVDPAQLSDFLVEVYVDALNDADTGAYAGKDVIGHYHALHLAPDKEVDWLSEEPITITLSGPASIPTGQTAPGAFKIITGVTHA